MNRIMRVLLRRDTYVKFVDTYNITIRHKTLFLETIGSILANGYRDT